MKTIIRRNSGRRLVTLTALTLAALPATACRAGNAQDTAGLERGPASVRIAPVEREMVVQPVSATGTFGPKDEIALSFKVGGVVAQVSVDAGARVSKGQRLAALDLREIDASLEKARSAASKADRDLERARRLYADSVATLSQAQDAETAATLAHADLDAASFNHAHAVITAPADGVILRRSVEPGENVSSGAPVLVLGSRTRGAVMRVGLADRDVVRVAAGDTAQVVFDALPGRTFRGRVTEIGAVASPGTGTYSVEVTLHDAGDLVSGMVGDARIFPSTGVSASMVPVEALVEADGSRASVFALSPDGAHAVRHDVQVAFLDGGRVALASGMKDVTSVITAGAAWLNDGQAVRVVR